MVEKETAKEFVLKDETGVIKCIFYQIVSTPSCGIHNITYTLLQLGSIQQQCS